MKIQRSDDTGSNLASEVYDQAVEFYWDHLRSIKNLFVDNDEEDINLIMQDLDVHWHDALATLNHLAPSDMFDSEEISRIVKSEVATNNLDYSDLDMTEIIKRLVDETRFSKDSIYKEAVCSYIDELNIEIDELISKSKNEVTEAKGEWIA